MSVIRETSTVDTKDSVDRANKAVFLKALRTARTPKSQRPKFNIAYAVVQSDGKVPLYRQVWFRKMCNRFANGERIYEGRAKGLGLYENEKLICEHQICRHRETFHVREISTSSGHISKRKVYLHFGTKGHVDCMVLAGGY